jgi:hypothetical protein
MLWAQYDGDNVNVIEVDTTFWFEYSASTNVYSCPEWDWIGQKNSFILCGDSIISRKNYLNGVYVATLSSEVLNVLRKKTIKINDSVMKVYTKIDSFIYRDTITSENEIILSQNLIYKKFRIKMMVVEISKHRRLIPNFNAKDISCRDVTWENVPIFVITNIIDIFPK